MTTTYTKKSAARVGALALAVAVLAVGQVEANEGAGEDFVELAARCAPAVHPTTLAAVVRHESGFNPLAIGVNGKPAIRVKATTLDEAVRAAEGLIAKGRSVDLGLGQVNSENLRWLGLSVRDAFDPCRNLAASSRVLTENYVRYSRAASTQQAALDAALSAYNTGNKSAGIRNGYVAKVRRAAGQRELPEVAAPPPAQPAQAWDTFGRAAQDRATWDPFARSAGARFTGATALNGGAQ